MSNKNRICQTKYNKKMGKRFLDGLSKGLSLAEVSREIGVIPNTIQKWAKEKKEFNVYFEQAKNNYEAFYLEMMRTSIEQDDNRHIIAKYMLRGHKYSQKVNYLDDDGEVLELSKFVDVINSVNCDIDLAQNNQKLLESHAQIELYRLHKKMMLENAQDFSENCTAESLRSMQSVKNLQREIRESKKLTAQES
jgi:transposase-like protein